MPFSLSRVQRIIAQRAETARPGRGSSASPPEFTAFIFRFRRRNRRPREIVMDDFEWDDANLPPRAAYVVEVPLTRKSSLLRFPGSQPVSFDLNSLHLLEAEE